MAVVINEFDVVPERPDDSRPAPATSHEPAALPKPAAELERELRALRERLDRVRAN